MIKLKKFVTIALSAVLTTAALTGCSSSSDDSTAKEDGKGSVYYLNFKPESESQWKKIAEDYEKETGVKVKVVTAASGTYEQTLKSEIAKKDAPTLFQINGPVGYESWKEYCADLKDTNLYSKLLNQDMAIKDGDGVYGIPYVEEGYGIIYNQEIMDKYFALDGAKAKSIDEINNFTKLKEVSEDMQSKKDQLGIDGVFASTSLTPGEDWRWQTHLANLPVYYEYKDKGVSNLDKIDFTYSDNFKNIFDLYINNSTCEPTLLGSKTVSDSMAEFALGKAAMVQNGNWGWSQIAEVEGNTVKAENVKFMPIYTGIEGEEKQGLCIGTENFFSINSKASEADQKASIEFVEWLFTSDTGKNHVTNELGFIAPFNTFKDSETPQDPLAKEVLRYLGNKDLYNVDWNFTSFPSQTFKDDFGAALLEYCNGNMKWEDVKKLVVEEWASEKEASK
ncbi:MULTISPECIES: ABC transporter substrate-binding protein [Romboutsia]|uniref:ABC transporter, solute-binding protein n=1 Tax=Romboutsia hominis TaxID=1507512 RepID=A0A2P2BY60_9FIRM|nr:MULTISPECIES: ABC transporter substrate-binding protein [Romboutsia]MCH1959092.1 ABC transporter substrate-binding protein [Romboutsia hominis]MCH1968212.1 ABC transporter substrate-binding protein [Romboutsia hominis]MDB8794873.1 ABC transporter substrate-binding protein [Romboutsia sp. 1001216sp1]MDB8797709.1 ABC transporter substrate-binding protein [Romboutsia sp. 1001216sp1]MDB8800531.1 ABC transporter substrate-binding protein [Romboutsia sp. 1001216sp1]